MSGTPTEAEIQTQWKAAIAILEDTRELADNVMAGASGYFDDLQQALEGEYTPAGLSGAVQRFRDTMSSLIESSRALEFLAPILYEYSRVFTTGDGYTDLFEIAKALWEHLDGSSATVESRNITYGTPSNTAGNVGNGAMSRMTVDEAGSNLESCYVEVKSFRCRLDQNSGVKEEAEVFDFIGEAASQDGLLRGATGSSTLLRTSVTSLSARPGRGGSLLHNGSFSDYSATATPKFRGWTETAGGANIAQDTTNFYRSFPGASVDGSLKITGGSGTVTLTQNLEDMATRRLNPDAPYFLRVMLNKSVGSALGGTVNLKLGSQTVSVAISALSSGWNELIIPLNKDCWFRNFNVDPFTVVIEWSQGTASGYLLVDDMIFQEMQRIDGTYWVLRGNHATHLPWLVDDKITATDTGGAPGTGKLQYWMWVAGLPSLPNAIGGSITDPV